MIRAAGLSKDSVVKDVVCRFVNGWPMEWIERCPALMTNPIPSLSNKKDEVEWCSNNQRSCFTVSKAWSTLDGNWPIVRWTKVVWFKGCIPKYSFCSWLAFLRRLPTQDKIQNWKQNPPDLKCLFCGSCMDSHNHLFFECRFALDVWTKVKEDADMKSFANKWDIIAQRIEDGSCVPKSCIQKLALTVTIYYIWQERNRRLFDDTKRSVAQISEEIRKIISMRIAWRCQARRCAVKH